MLSVFYSNVLARPSLFTRAHILSKEIGTSHAFWDSLYMITFKRKYNISSGCLVQTPNDRAQCTYMYYKYTHMYTGSHKKYETWVILTNILKQIERPSIETKMP